MPNTDTPPCRDPWDTERLGPQVPLKGIHLELTEDQFVDRYEPETDEEGNLYVQREWKHGAPGDREALEKAVAENRCWTAMEDDEGLFCLAEGNHVVNRLFNIITKLPLENPDWTVYVRCEEPGDREYDDEDEEE